MKEAFTYITHKEQYRFKKEKLLLTSNQILKNKFTLFYSRQNIHGLQCSQYVNIFITKFNYWLVPSPPTLKSCILFSAGTP
jgi:hypothetical protein